MSGLAALPVRGSSEYRELVTRRPIADEVWETVREIVGYVRASGDRAVLELTERLDRVRLDRTRVPEQEAAGALEALDGRLRGALAEAARRIEAVHRVQAFHEDPVAVTQGVRVWREWRPFQRVGLYAPGGRTVYPSSVLMMAVPARLAGCREIVLCSPPQRDGHVAPAILAAAALCGVTEIHAIGGAQAVAALAYGTESLERVAKIFGPGNSYVTVAKLQVFGEVAIDMPAGPSEIVVISDGSAPAEWLATDLRAQAEHSPDAIALLVTTAESDAAALNQVPEAQVKGFRCADLAQAIGFANDFAPEHLTLACRNPEQWLSLVTSAGSIFLGIYAGAAAGDYATGANHVLPTGGAARSFGALGVEAFGRAVQVQSVEATGIEAIAAVSDVLAAAEDLPWHAASIRQRSR
ncbi:MAG TPA: histidinol dehydrogenase [Candidatus Dormibacteraeota bacterium]|jgi:histidinol dehydrogenase|nr:histidinol dehydrogenase [Candidatus Dormibacteraeota bacterium]